MTGGRPYLYNSFLPGRIIYNQAQVLCIVEVSLAVKSQLILRRKKTEDQIIKRQIELCCANGNVSCGNNIYNS